ncbi:RNA polymerase sigma-70 factor [Olivibacter ginsenosidimutans]|uniref:RNA polymerase sigma-70 factor n=1 Tax=Olivibacter ginsenosidimutans TaxID=1176537 RepID=A0ABP9AF04_9SPHI
MDEKALLIRIASGDEQAFRIIFDRYRIPIYRYALKIVKSEQVAEEIVHDVFLTLWQHENPSAIEAVEAYIKVVARNAALQVLRRGQLEQRVGNQLKTTWEETHNQTEEAILFNESTILLRQAIALLPPQQRQVYLLCREEGLKYAQAAERLSLSPLTVKTHMLHALRFLRNYLSQHSDLVLLLSLFLYRYSVSYSHFPC